MTASLVVRRTGPLTLVEDLGRPGYAAVGVGRSGAADRAALRLANRAVGNAEGAAGLEVLLGGLEVEVRGWSAVAVRHRRAGAGERRRSRDRPLLRHALSPMGTSSGSAARRTA